MIVCPSLSIRDGSFLSYVGPRYVQSDDRLAACVTTLHCTREVLKLTRLILKGLITRQTLRIRECTCMKLTTCPKLGPGRPINGEGGWIYIEGDYA